MESTTENTASQKLRKITLSWMLTVLVLFIVLLLVGAAMRILQSDLLVTPPEWFYAFLTLHGLGMVGVWYVGSMAGVSQLISRYVEPRPSISRLAFGATALGVVLLLLTTLVGRLGVGWYFLYPLPLYPQGVWPPWSIGAFLGALAVLGVGWTVWSFDVLYAIARRYSLSTALAWPYLKGRSQPELPPVVLITTVSMICALAGFVAAVVVLVLFTTEWLSTGFKNDALLMKNLTFFFGHVLVNITMYLAVAITYEVLPRFAGRPWKVNRIVAVAWNAVLFLVLFAYLHHLYMDFAQPRWLQFFGQISSYLISVPAAVVSIFGALLLVYRSPMKWTLTSSLLYLGIMGWAIGGVAAVIDSTVAANVRFHNTQWVPAHFHTYFLMGAVLMILGFAYWFPQELTRSEESPGLARLILALVVLGGYGFLMTFYYGGALSVPRRFASYPAEVLQGTTQARLALVFVALLFAGFLLYTWETGKRCVKALRA